MTRRPSVQALRDEALELLDDDPDGALRRAREAVVRQPDAESHYVLGLALCATGDEDAGHVALTRATELDASHADAWCALGQLHFDALRFEEAAAAVRTCLRVDPHHPDALLVRAWLRERRGDHDGAARDYQAAALVSPDDHPLPLALDEETVAQVADEVVASFDASFQEMLQDVHILVEDVPSEDVLRSFDPPALPHELLGCFNGASLIERTLGDAWGALPATIQLFRCNLARVASDREELLEEVRVTLLHEIGHYLGLDEDDLEARGLD
jgi:predicted Zn-dependent protease with MMP-like domain